MTLEFDFMSMFIEEGNNDFNSDGLHNRAGWSVGEGLDNAHQHFRPCGHQSLPLVLVTNP